MNKPEVTSDKYSKSIKISLVLCWIGLIVCCLIKLFGGNFFSIDVKSSRFIEVCNYIDNNIVLLYLIQIISYFLVSYLYFSAILRTARPTTKDALIILVTTIILFVIKCINYEVASICEIIILILLPIIVWKVKWYKSLLYQVIYNIFCLISVFTKSIGNLQLPDNALTGTIFMLDVYFMLTLFMLYNLKKGDKKNGQMGF